jgi:ABC-type Fe3+ transport system permease subunit
MKNGFLTFCFAFVPGAGQMYQGYMKRGLSLISLFCVCCMLATGITQLIILAPIVWMYSFFDTFNLRGQLGAGNAPADDYLVHGSEDEALQALLGRHRLAGWLLVALGVYLLYDKVLFQMVTRLYWTHRGNWVLQILYQAGLLVPTLVLAAGLIALGVWLVRGVQAAPEPPTEEVPFYSPAQAAADEAPADEMPADEAAEKMAEEKPE